MDHVWSILCTKHLVDPQSQMISIIDGVDVLNVPRAEVPDISDKKAKQNFALGGIPLQLVTIWSRSDFDQPETGTARSALICPDKKRYNQPENTIDLSTAPTSRVILVINVLVYRGPGLYRFVVEKKSPNSRWIRSANLPLHVRLVDSEPERSTPGKPKVSSG